MNKLFYLKLAWINIKKNRQTYIPYLLTCIGSMSMFFIMHSISVNQGIYEMIGSETLQMILSFGLVVIGIFSTIFLFYTNSFLIKRRTKELGLYNVLGLEKKHIAKILCYETLMTSGISFAFGLCSGVVLNKLMILVLLKILRIEVPFNSSIDFSSFQVTVLTFIFIFGLTLITNLIHLLMSNPLQLLKAGQVGEKEPKARWFRAILGFISLGIGYGIALSVDSPLHAINLFFIAVIFVMYGTSEIFTTGSIAILKLLRQNKKFYYRSQNFVAVSGMMYRMKQNAVGLSNICILSTAVLVIVSTTVSLYVGIEDSLRQQYPTDITIYKNEMTVEQVKTLNEVFDQVVDETNVEVVDKFDYWLKSVIMTCKGGQFDVAADSRSMLDLCIVGLMSIEDYNRIENQFIALADNEVLVHRVEKSYDYETAMINGEKFIVKDELNHIETINRGMTQIVDTYIFIVNDLSIIDGEPLGYEMDANMKNNDDEIINFVHTFNQKVREAGLELSAGSRAQAKDEIYGMNGGFFFLGIFLGTLFLMATGLIIYYKQISEGFDDQERFDIMQRVGMSHTEVRKTIRQQILMVFFLPLAFTILHVVVAFPIITKILVIFNIINQTLLLISTIITVLVFALVYGLIFMLTARTYYRIVERS